MEKEMQRNKDYNDMLTKVESVFCVKLYVTKNIFSLQFFSICYYFFSSITTLHLYSIYSLYEPHT